MEEQDYKTIARSRLTDRHRSDEVVLAILDTAIEIKEQRQAQYLEIASKLLDIDESTGKNLDLIGNLIGESRTLVNFIDRPYFGFMGARLAESYDVGYWYSLYKNKYGTLRTLSDEEYRRVLKARVIKNSSDNNRNSLLEVLNVLSGNTSTIVIEDVDNKAISVQVEDNDGLVSYYLSKYKSDRNLIPVPLGRRIGISYSESSDTPTISCDGAIPSCELQHDSDRVTLGEISAISLNGILYTKDEYGDYNFPPDTINIQGLRRPIVHGKGWNWEYYGQIDNLSNINMKLEIFDYSGGEGTLNQNPTLDLTSSPATVCLSPQVPCEPTSLSIDLPTLEGVKTILFSRGGPAYEVSADFSTISDNNLIGMLKAINDHQGQDIFVFDGFTEGSFQVIGSDITGASGDGADSMTIILWEVEADGVLFNSFGQKVVELHSCGLFTG